MQVNQHSAPREAISGIASGSLLMAAFTTVWAMIADHNLNGRDKHILLAFFLVLAAGFLVNSIYLFSITKQFSAATSAEALAEKKRTGKWFGIIFGLEGIAIPIVVNIAIMMHHPELVIPAIALIVGLHFYPMAWVFKRTIDYYLATWTTTVAIGAIVLCLKHSIALNDIDAFVGVGLAISTASYGLYMIYNGRNLSNKPVLA